jgi:hypothetical protein
MTTETALGGLVGRLAQADPDGRAITCGQDDDRSAVSQQIDRNAPTRVAERRQLTPPEIAVEWDPQHRSTP